MPVTEAEEAETRRKARIIKEAGGSPQAVLELMDAHGAQETHDLLVHLKQDIEAQFSQHKASWGQKPPRYLSESEWGAWREGHQNYLRWKKNANRYKAVIETALAHAKRLLKQRRAARRKHRAPGRPEWSEEEKIRRIEQESFWVAGAAVRAMSGASGWIAARCGKRVHIFWDALPGVPVEYSQPWFQDVVLLEEQ